MSQTESATARETRGFQTEVRQLLQLMIHSLYSNKEIFLRELISNASDAADKLRFAALSDAALLGEDGELRIDVEIDPENRRIAVADNGIGMSRDELIDNLGTIAKSGTAEFLQSMTGDASRDARLIGQFGVGFYSAFIVAERVVVDTCRAGTAEAHRWESTGEGEFSIAPGDRECRGTRVELYLRDGEDEFLDANRIEALIRKYSDHIGFPVSLRAGDAERRAVNSATALWTRPRNEVDDDEYREFYKHLAHDLSDPLAWSHNRVEGRREYTSLLYLPRQAPFDLWNRDAPRGLKLYVQRVFIMDDAEQFLPLYLRFVRGIVDSADLPLNVSRELLQQHPDLQAMRAALTKRVLDMLKKLAAGDDYAAFWQQFGQVMKEGIIEDADNRETLAGLLRFATTHTGTADQDQSLADVVSRAGADRDSLYYLIADSYETAVQSPQLERLRADGIEVLLLTDRIDPWLVDHLTEFDGKRLVDISRGDVELPADGKLSRDALDEEAKPLLKKIRRVLQDRIDTVRVSQRLVDSAACVVAGENDLTPSLRRMLEATGQDLPETKPVLEINVDHPLLQRLDATADDSQFSALANVVLDHALLADGGFLEKPAEHVQRVNDLLLALDNTAARG